MPRCEGLPDGPCPQNVNNRSVKLTQGDLMLCPKCDSTRFQPPLTNPGIVTAKVNVTAKPKKLVSAATNANSGATGNNPTRSDSNQSQPGLDSESDVPISVVDQALSSKVATGNTQPNSKQEIGNKESGDQTSDDDDDGAVTECSHCLLATTGSGRRVMCDICRQYQHQKCTSMNAKIFDKFITHVEITGWVCDDCKIAARQSNQRLAAAVAHLAEQVASLKQEMASINGSTLVTDQGALASVRVQQPGADTVLESSNISKINETATMLIVQRTINDTTRRKRNVVITGLPERINGDDKSAFLSLCEEQLPMKPVVAEKDCIRLGKKSPSKPRRLLVKLDSEETAVNLLRAAPMLRNSTDQGVAHSVYINPDLSPAASQLAYEARKARRESAARRGRTSMDNATLSSTSREAAIPSSPAGAPNQTTASQSFRGN
jgi:hypothetical protein